MKSFLFSAYAMVHLNPHLSVLPDLHSAGLGHLYFDNNQFSVCISGTSVALHHRSRTDAHSTTMDLQACQPNQTVPILTYDNKLEVFSLSSAIRPWCFGTDKSGSLFVGSFSEAPDAHVDWPAARCVHFSPHVQRTVRIDFSVISSSSHSESSVATDIQRCSGFTELLYPANNQEHVFTMLTGMGRRRRDIEFWLDFCGVVLPTVHVWDYSNYYNDDIRSPLSYISRCNVRHVTGMDLGAAGGESVAAPGRVVCVEEFLEQLLLSRRTGNGDVAGVTFLSAVTGPPSSNGNDDLVLWQREHTNEILGVVGAFVETGFAELNVRNLWSSTTGQNDDILLDSIRIALDQQSIQSTSDEWSQGIDTLWSLAESCYGHNQESPSMQQRLCWSRFPMLLAHELNYRMGLKNGLSNHICVIDCQDDAIYWQRQELARFLRRVSVSAVEHGLTHFRQYSMGCNSRNTMSRFLSEFCSQIESERVTSSVGQLLLLSKDLFQLPHPLIGNGVNIDDNSGIRDFEIAPLKHNIFYRTFLSQSPENYSRKYAAGAYDLPFSFTAGRYSADDSHLENEIISIKNSEGKIYVLCFVESDMDLLQARIIIQKWREGCDGCRFHAVFTVYLVPPCAQKTLRSYTSGCTLRYALLAMHEWIVTNTVKVDIVVSLIGIEAMLAFRHPGISKTGILPSCDYGGFAYYRLKSPIIVSFSVVKRIPSISGTADFRAFAGVASSMKTMIENIRKYDPFYVADIQLETMEISEAQFRAGLRYSAGGIPGAILRHIRSRYPGAVMEQIFDMTSSFFDFSHSTWDSKDLHRVIQNLDDDSHKEVDYTSLILSDRIDGDMLLPKLRTGQPVHFADISNQITLAATLMNNFNCLDSIIAAAKVYLMFSGVLPQVPGGLHFFLEFSKKFYLYSHNTSLLDKLNMLGVFEVLDRNSPKDLFVPHVEGAAPVHKIVYKIAQASVYQEIGPVDLEVRTFGDTITPIPYSIMKRDIQTQMSWAEGINIVPRVYIITVASSETDGLRALLTSANLAGVIVEVVGLGREYTDYTQKIVWYLETLDGVNTSLRIREEDIVVLIDAYDVLLLPAARLIPQIMAQFSTPIVFCSENGIYPEFASPWFYPRGYATDRQFNKFNQGDQRFLNSGCIAGSMKYVRSMLRDVAARNEVFRDDQQVFVRYMIENPHLVSIDDARKLFLTAYKEPMQQYAVNYVLGLVSTQDGVENMLGTISLIHCNNKDSNTAYYSMISVLHSFYNDYLAGNDGNALLAAIHSIWDGDWRSAKRFLDQEVVLLNASTPDGYRTPRGGTNILSHKLKEYLLLLNYQ